MTKVPETTFYKGYFVAHLDYDQMIQESLRDVVRKAIDEVAKSGLSSSHHFYITFRTDRSDVKMPEYLREQHPEEVTIVLQHQFWNLSTDSKSFKVTLSFNGVQERVEVPFTALVSFMDPSVKFGLQFTPEKPDNVSPKKPEKEGKSATPKGEKVVTLDAFRNKKK